MRCDVCLGHRWCNWLAWPLLLSTWTAAVAAAGPATAFVPSQRWSTTASGSAGAQGSPITLTWSVVPDGTMVPGIGASGLVGLFDETFGAGIGGSDLKQRPWFFLLESSLDRWSELSGITFQFEPHDDGVPHSQLAGQLGVRGDIRFAGASLDGPNNTLALSTFTNNADILLDTDDFPLFSIPTSNYLRFRNVLMHELGHCLGFEHVESSNAAFLMEPALNIGFDGPQLDDIRAVQWYYGDVLEKSNGGLGNGSTQLATDLGLVAPGGMVSVGADAGPDLAVAGDETDFASIHNGQDKDFFSIRVEQPSLLDAALAPRGGIYNQGSQGGQQTPIDANSRSDLSLAVFDTDGTSLLASMNHDGAGTTETISDLFLPTAGEYFVRVAGASAQVQLYQLELSITSAAITLQGDYNLDGAVDAADYSVWRDSLGRQGTGLAADGNGDEVVDQLDYDLWKSSFGSNGSGVGSRATSTIPEPSSIAIACAAFLAGVTSRKRWRRAEL